MSILMNLSRILCSCMLLDDFSLKFRLTDLKGCICSYIEKPDNPSSIHALVIVLIDIFDLAIRYILRLHNMHPTSDKYYAMLECLKPYVPLESFYGVVSIMGEPDRRAVYRQLSTLQQTSYLIDISLQHLTSLRSTDNIKMVSSDNASMS